MAVVIDFGPRAGRVRDVVVRCIEVPQGANGTVVLASLAASAGVPAPTYNDSGLLCSIDGLPTSGCGTAVAGGYAYWSYWHGGTHWAFANVGPAEWQAQVDDVEGWRFESDSTGTGSDVAPRAPSTYLAACATAASTPFPVNGPQVGSSTTTTIAATLVALLAAALAAASIRRWRRRAP